MDPFTIPRYLALVITAGVRRFGWKIILVGWALATALAVVLQQSL